MHHFSYHLSFFPSSSPVLMLSCTLSCWCFSLFTYPQHFFHFVTEFVFLCSVYLWRHCYVCSLFSGVYPPLAHVSVVCWCSHEVDRFWVSFIGVCHFIPFPSSICLIVIVFRGDLWLVSCVCMIPIPILFSVFGVIPHCITTLALVTLLI